MKKILLPRRNALISPGRAVTVMVLGGIVLVIVLLRVFLPGFFVAVAAPAFKVGAVLTTFTDGIRAKFTDAATLARERDTLREENLALTNQNLAFAAQIDDLTKLLGQSPSTSLGTIAGVLAHPPQSPYDTLIVAAGSTDGIAPHMQALAMGDIPIGTVESVTAESARITLYSSPGQVLSGWVGEKRTPITITGAGGGAFSATAPKSAGVVEGDIVYLASGSAAPLGTVLKVASTLSSPSTTLYITPLANMFSIVWVKLVP